MSGLSHFLIISAYFLGTIPSLRLFNWLSGGEALAKNQQKLTACGVTVLDFLKGILPVAVGLALNLSPSALGGVAFAVCLGHIFPVFNRFEGGKGTVTALGVILPMSFGIAGLALATWLVSFLVLGYRTASAVLTALVLPAYVWWLRPELTFPIALVCCLIVYRYHDNIQDMWRGLEPKVRWW
ncbi:glycerol-3-phosphate acyltransferase [Pasteurellaceae bacterium RH1A]|nr:glycerol-3-phosphate acyltransferase [Pasteurellaceae bacterium RH1A]